MKKSKSQLIKEHLLSGKSLTQWQCTQKFNYLRLSAFIHVLRKQGIDIVTINERNSNDNGIHAKYILRGK